MTDATRDALIALAAALAADHDGAEALSFYGELPSHLADAIDELIDDTDA